MQGRLQAVVLGAALATVAGCASNVSTDYNPNTGFANLHTYALVTPTDRKSHQLLDDRVRTSVVSQLTAKGMREADRDHADVLVGYGVVDRTRAQINDSDWGPAWGWRYNRWGVPWPLDTRVEDIDTYKDGSVVVSLVSAKTHRVVWQGEASDVVDLPVNDPKHADTEINHAVAKILEKYPPRTNA